MRCLAGRKPQHAHQLQSEEQSNHHHVLDRVLCHPYQTKELLDTPRSSLLKFAPVTVSCKLKKQDPDLCGEIQSFPPFEACLSAASALAFCQR